MLNCHCLPSFLIGCFSVLIISTCLPAQAKDTAANAKASTALAKPQQKPKRTKADYEDQNIRVRLILRSPSQIAAFYEGRQFPAAAVKQLSQVCFVAAIIKNKTKDRLWLDLNQWQFKTASGIVNRLDRAYWKTAWMKAGIDKASQATFGWTLLPDTRGLYPGEGVGGNITLPALREAFSITARFDRGAKRNLAAITITLDHVHCKQDGDGNAKL